MKKVGIEAASFYVPELYLEIAELAQNRGIDAQKLEKGLGLKKMAVLYSNEDTATLAAEALYRLFLDYDLNPNEISRIYLGTESALDAAKPTITYAIQMIEMQLKEKFGKRCFKNCDVTDITFACIGGIDVLQNALDFVRVNPNKKAIVIAADYAKYELNSSGEYTQGAGAVALLVSSTPNLLEIENIWGVSIESVHDFFKPRRLFNKSDLTNAPEFYPDKIEIFTDEPIFDGQYSNECFKERIKEAYLHFKSEKKTSKNVIDSWIYLIFHLPYAFHGKRIFNEIFAMEYGLSYATKEDIKLVVESEAYKKIVNKKIELSQRASSEIGNMYTASIFMALFSTLQVAFDEAQSIEEKTIGFFAYGSGSKAKVFEGKISTNWKSVVSKWNLFESLKQRVAIDFKTYIHLHRKQIQYPKTKGFVLKKIESDLSKLEGIRDYTILQ